MLNYHFESGMLYNVTDDVTWLVISFSYKNVHWASKVCMDRTGNSWNP